MYPYTVVYHTLFTKNVDSYACKCDHNSVTVLRHTDSHPLPAQAYKDTLFCTHTTLPSSHSNAYFPPHPTSPLSSFPFLPIPLTHTHAALAHSCKLHGVLLGHYRNRIKCSVGICNSMVCCGIWDQQHK